MGSLINILIHNIYKIVGNFCLKLLNLLLIFSPVELRASHCVIKIRSTDLNTHRSLNGFVMDVVSLYSHFSHWLRCQKSSNCCHNRAVETCQNNSVSHI